MDLEIISFRAIHGAQLVKYKVVLSKKHIFECGNFDEAVSDSMKSRVPTAPGKP